MPESPGTFLDRGVARRGTLEDPQEYILPPVFHARPSDVPHTANRAVALLSRMYGTAASWGMVQVGTSSCRGTGQHPERLRERFLTDTEFRRPGAMRDQARPTMGCRSMQRRRSGFRKSMILSLHRENVDLVARALSLADSKTDPRAVPLSPVAVRVLAGYRAGTALGDLQFLDHMIDTLPVAQRARYFPDCASVRISLSSVRSGTTFWSRAFSLQELLQPMRLVNLLAAVLTAPAIVTLFRYTETAVNLSERLAATSLSMPMICSGSYVFRLIQLSFNISN